jgi:hypothetical protein
MHTRFQMALVAATITVLYSPGVSLAKPRAHLKAHAALAGMTRYTGLTAPRPSLLPGDRFLFKAGQIHSIDGTF